jgi:cbb3-type cytochrome oxidase maturation protein
MEIMYLLVPLSAGVVLLIIGVFGWAISRGQFEDLDAEGERILLPDDEPLDGDQGMPRNSS